VDDAKMGGKVNKAVKQKKKLPTDLDDDVFFLKKEKV